MAKSLQTSILANSTQQIFNGLQLTVFQNKLHKQSTSNAIQIFHVNEDHWVRATTIGTARKVVLYMIHGIQSGINPQYLCLQNNFNVISIASKYLTRYRNSKVELNVDYMQLPMLLALHTEEILHNFYIV